MTWTFQAKPSIEPNYISVYAFDRPLERGTGGADDHTLDALVFDFDSERDISLARKDAVHLIQKLQVVYDVAPGQLGIYFSGKKGFHVLVPIYCLTGEFLAQAHASQIHWLCNEIAEGFSTYDPSIYDHRRIVRIPGAVHRNRYTRKVQLTFDEITSEPLSVIADKYSYFLSARPPYFMVQQPEISSELRSLWQVAIARPRLDRGGGSAVRPVHSTESEPRLENYFQPVNRGARNRSLAQLVGIIGKHVTDQRIVVEIARMWNRQNAEPLSDFDVVGCVTSVLNTINAKENHGQREVSKPEQPEYTVPAPTARPVTPASAGERILSHAQRIIDAAKLAAPDLTGGRQFGPSRGFGTGRGYTRLPDF
jgi:hypothetical protein